MAIKPHSAEQRVVLNINGMTCTACAQTVESALRRVPGVASATLSLSDDTAAVAYDPAAVKVRDMMAAVEAAGYGAGADEVAFVVDGLAGGPAAQDVERRVERLDGVVHASASLGADTVRVSYVRGAASVESIRQRNRGVRACASWRYGATISSRPTWSASPAPKRSARCGAR